MALPRLPIDEIRALCRRYGVRELAIFGSALGEEFRDDSDLDFLVEFEPDIEVGFLTLARMQRELSEALHRKVDLVTKGGLKPLIHDEIISSRKVLYAATRDALELRAGIAEILDKEYR